MYSWKCTNTSPLSQQSQDCSKVQTQNALRLKAASKLWLSVKFKKAVIFSQNKMTFPSPNWAIELSWTKTITKPQRVSISSRGFKSSVCSTWWWDPSSGAWVVPSLWPCWLWPSGHPCWGGCARCLRHSLVQSLVPSTPASTVSLHCGFGFILTASHDRPSEAHFWSSTPSFDI